MEAMPRRVVHGGIHVHIRGEDEGVDGMRAQGEGRSRTSPREREAMAADYLTVA